MGFSQQQLAVRIGVALPTVSHRETGRSWPSPLAAEKIRRVLDGMGPAGGALVKRLRLHRNRIPRTRGGGERVDEGK